MRLTLVIALALAVCACSSETTAPKQPLEFSHALHLSKATTDKVKQRQLVCTDCHAGAERGEHAGLPALKICLGCHMKLQKNDDGKASPEEAKVRAFAAKTGPFQWIQVTRNPGHVYFSHRAHVGIAKMTCTECHGDVSKWTEPPTKANLRLQSMDSCMACHRQRKASNECVACHR